MNLSNWSLSSSSVPQTRFACTCVMGKSASNKAFQSTPRLRCAPSRPRLSYVVMLYENAL